jgi:HlyD family secretion protein
MFRVLTNRRVLISLAGIGGLLALALWPTTPIVDTATVSRGALVVTVDEEGRTRIRDRFVVSAPVTGRVLRIELQPGDPVRRGAIMARVRAETPPLLDARTRAEAEAAVESASAALGRARAEEQRARTALAQAQRELTRSHELAAAGGATAQQFEAREADAQLAQEVATAAEFAVRAASAELQRAQVRLVPSSPDPRGGIVTVIAPVDGVVLRRLRESESVVPAGEPLLELGDPCQLEIVADLLSTDAVRVSAGARATIEQWGKEAVLDARVRRIEPAGFTKISALGVEEQRVNVVLDLVDRVEPCTALGDAYRVEVRIVIWETSSVLKVPTSALFRDGERWAVYAVNAGRARRTIVELGHQTGREAEVTSGLSAGARVIVHPGDQITDGARIKERTSS